MIYLTSTSEAAIIAADLKISQNCDLANEYGTVSWSKRPPEKAVNSDLWFFPKPPAEGWGNGNTFYTQAQMMEGVDLTDIVEMERDEDWFPEPVEII